MCLCACATSCCRAARQLGSTCHVAAGTEQGGLKLSSIASSGDSREGDRRSVMCRSLLASMLACIRDRSVPSGGQRQRGARKDGQSIAIISLAMQAKPMCHVLRACSALAPAAAAGSGPIDRSIVSYLLPSAIHIQATASSHRNSCCNQRIIFSFFS